MEITELLKLLGIVVVIAGFALKLDSILIVFAAAVVTAIVGGLGVDGFLEQLGTNFTSNRSMAIFILILLVTGTLERNGLREAAAALIGKIRGVTSGKLICVYGVMRSFFGAFNVNFGGVAGFIRPVVLPMAEGALEAQKKEIKEDYMEEVKGMASAMENVAWFFFQVLFVGGAGGLLVQSTMKALGYEVELIDFAAASIPMALTALVVGCIYFLLRDKKLRKIYYGDEK